MKEEHIEAESCVQTVLPGTMFRVELAKHLVLASIREKNAKTVRPSHRGRPRQDGMSPYDLNKGRITWRLR
jgi:translation initiation factor IF-1